MGRSITLSGGMPLIYSSDVDRLSGTNTLTHGFLHLYLENKHQRVREPTKQANQPLGHRAERGHGGARGPELVIAEDSHKVLFIYTWNNLFVNSNNYVYSNISETPLLDISLSLCIRSPFKTPGIQRALYVHRNCKNASRSHANKIKVNINASALCTWTPPQIKAGM